MSTRFAHCGGSPSLLQANLRKLDIPVAENIPDEIIELLNCDAELESLEIVRNLFDEVVIEAEHPLILERKLIGQTRFFGAVEVHKDKACGVPELVRKVAARFDLFGQNISCRFRGCCRWQE